MYQSFFLLLDDINANGGSFTFQVVTALNAGQMIGGPQLFRCTLIYYTCGGEVSRRTDIVSAEPSHAFMILMDRISDAMFPPKMASAVNKNCEKPTDSTYSQKMFTQLVDTLGGNWSSKDYLAYSASWQDSEDGRKVDRVFVIGRQVGSTVTTFQIRDRPLRFEDMLDKINPFARNSIATKEKEDFGWEPMACVNTSFADRLAEAQY